MKVVSGGPPPLLEVVSLTANGGAVIAGAPSVLTLTLRNAGTGYAYRVVVQTRSGEPSMHGLRFVMGSIKPGGVRARTATVNVPRTHSGGQGVVVLRFSEANNNVPNQAARRIAIRAGKRPALSLSCRLVRGVKKSGTSLSADAGVGILARCQLRNGGNAAAVNTAVTARLGSGQAKRSSARTIRAGGKVQIDLYVRVPASAKTGQQLRLVLDARETSMAATARQQFTIEVGQQRICTPPISRATYNSKLRALKASKRRGDIDAKTFGEFEAQLVGCLP